MASQHEHDIVTSMKALEAKLSVIPDGPAQREALAEFERLRVLIAGVGYTF